MPNNIILRSLSSGEQRRSFCASAHPPNGGYLPLLTVASWCLEVWASLFTRVRRGGVLRTSPIKSRKNSPFEGYTHPKEPIPCSPKHYLRKGESFNPLSRLWMAGVRRRGVSRRSPRHSSKTGPNGGYAVLHGACTLLSRVTSGRVSSLLLPPHTTEGEAPCGKTRRSTLTTPLNGWTS